MLDRTILIQNLTNLSDARYFAAWGAAYMSFNRNMGSPYFVEEERMKEIMDWVAGPQILIESNTIEYADNFDGQILDLAYASLPINKICFFRATLDQVINESREGKFIIPYQEDIKNRLKEIPLNSELLIDTTYLSGYQKMNNHLSYLPVSSIFSLLSLLPISHHLRL